MSSPAQAAPARKAALVFIFVTVLIDVLAFGIVIPVLPQLIKQLAGGMADAVSWVGILGTVFAIVQFFFNPIQGALSDRFGRRPVVLISNLGLGLDFILMALVQSLPWLTLARVISGMTSASFSTANAYIADVTPPDKRAGAFGMLGAAFGIGFVLGPALGGFLGDIDLRLPFWVAAGMALTNFCYGLFVLPESLPPERRSVKFDWKRANPVGALLLLARYPQVYALAGVVFLSQLAHYVLNTTFVLYADYRYGWGPREVGLTLGLVGVCNAVVQAVLVAKIVGRFGERRALLAGLLFGAFGFAWQGLAPTGLLSLLALPLLALWGCAGPSSQALMTRQVDAQEQGRLQGSLAGVVSMAGIIGPELYTKVFGWGIATNASWHVPGAAFFVAAALLCIGVVVAWRATAARHPRDTATAASES